MISYYGYELSPNQIETGEGFLICKNVPIARTGEQSYMGSEIGLDGADAGKVFRVFRPPEEVFSKAAMASFEGKPLTNDHPPGLIGPDDVSIYEKGHVQNVRKGSGEWEGYVLADLHVHDQELIDAIQSGKREISCGYDFDPIKNEDGTYTQHNIRGNHVAVVERGRAGKRAAILDSDKNFTAAAPPERKGNMKSKFLELFGLAASGKTSDEIKQMALDAADAMDEETPAAEPEKEPETPAKDEKPETPAFDESVIDGIVEKVLAKMMAKKAEEEMHDEDPIGEVIEKLTGGEAEVQPGGEAEDGEEAHVVPAEEMDSKDCGMAMDKAMAAGILKAMRPTVAAIKDDKQRKAVSDALIKCVTAQDAANDIANIMQAAQANAKAKAKPAMDMDNIQASYDALNPHKRKETK